MTRIWVTRDEPPEGALSLALRHAGLEPVREPVIERRVVADVGPMLRSLKPDDWLVLTSAYAVGAIGVDVLLCQVAVVGRASQEAATRRSLRVELVSPDGTAAGLWSALRARLGGTACVCFPRSSLAPPPPDIPGVRMLAPVLYETVAREFNHEVARTVAATAVTSPSAAGALAAVCYLPPCASIGPTTSATLRRHNIAVWLESPEPAFPALVRAIATRLSP